MTFYDKYKKERLSGQNYSGGRFISILTNQSPNTHPFHTLSSSNQPPSSLPPFQAPTHSKPHLSYVSSASLRNWMDYYAWANFRWTGFATWCKCYHHMKEAAAVHRSGLDTFDKCTVTLFKDWAERLLKKERKKPKCLSIFKISRGSNHTPSKINCLDLCLFVFFNRLKRYNF